MVTINTYYSVDKAYIDKAFLDSEGIESIILDSNLSGLGHFGAQVIGGIRLQVEDHYANRAREILIEHGANSNDFIAKQCPKCNGFDIQKENHFSIKNLYRYVFKGEKKPIMFHIYFCEDCHTRF